MKTYEEVATENGLNPGVAARFVHYMRVRWADKEAMQCRVGYAGEWAKRFKYGVEYSASDLEGRAVLERMGAPTSTPAWEEAMLGENFPRAQYEIIPNYLPPYPQVNERTKVVIRHKLCGNFLRYSKSPQTGSFWDIYGDDFLTEELALVELSKAPPCPFWKSDGLRALPGETP